jgi:hypothetical protein
MVINKNVRIDAINEEYLLLEVLFFAYMKIFKNNNMIKVNTPSLKVDSSTSF